MSLSPTEVKADMVQLAAEIERHNRLYYTDAAPEISDQEYDRLFRRLEKLEDAHPDLADPNSPTVVIQLSHSACRRRSPKCPALVSSRPIRQ